MARPLIVAAGAVVTRKSARGVEVLMVHRPKYDDWSWPKGKVDPGEHPVATAVREIEEETGLKVRLGPPLSDQQYLIRNDEVKDKLVHYWVGHLAAGEDGSLDGYEPNAEIDAVAWVPVAEAPRRLTYHRDRETLEEALALRKRTVALVVLRHGSAVSRKSWRHDDRDRPLDALGKEQAHLLVPLLSAYGVRTVLSSSSNRCWTTLEPFSDASGRHLDVTDLLSEEDATPIATAMLTGRLVGGGKPAVLCTHRPVLPWVFEALGVEPTKLEPGELLVVHLRDGVILALERHRPTPD